MILKMYSVYDVLSETFGVPFFCQNEAMAKRSFLHLAIDSQSTVYRSPQDFYLFEIGTFNDANGEVTDTINNKLVVKANELVRSHNENTFVV